MDQVGQVEGLEDGAGVVLLNDHDPEKDGIDEGLAGVKFAGMNDAPLCPGPDEDRVDGDVELALHVYDRVLPAVAVAHKVEAVEGPDDGLEERQEVPVADVFVVVVEECSVLGVEDVVLQVADVAARKLAGDAGVDGGDLPGAGVGVDAALGLVVHEHPDERADAHAKGSDGVVGLLLGGEGVEVVALVLGDGEGHGGDAAVEDAGDPKTLQVEAGVRTQVHDAVRLEAELFPADGVDEVPAVHGLEGVGANDELGKGAVDGEDVLSNVGQVRDRPLVPTVVDVLDEEHGVGEGVGPGGQQVVGEEEVLVHGHGRRVAAPLAQGDEDDHGHVPLEMVVVDHKAEAVKMLAKVRLRVGLDLEQRLPRGRPGARLVHVPPVIDVLAQVERFETGHSLHL